MDGYKKYFRNNDMCINNNLYNYIDDGNKLYK
jgi:hypothetical protein